MEQIFESKNDFTLLREKVINIKNEIHKIIVGQDKVIERIITAILSDGHILIEGVPGVAKTLIAKIIAKTISVDFKRIQFTPDLMPSDIIGTMIYNVKKSEFEFNKGPIFSNIILIDEINRAPAKTQAALFEVMEEKQITVDGITHKLSYPFMVIATQNPIEQEGTYRLPEAQLDRFLFKIDVDYPSLENEIQILNDYKSIKNKNNLDIINFVINSDELSDISNMSSNVFVEEKIIKYITEIVHNTRNSSDIYLGASPRASIAVMTGAQSLAAINGRDFVTPDDVKEVLFPALCHRLILSAEKEMEGITVNKALEKIIQKVEIPR